MGRELYFFKFDAELAREKLPPLIDKEENFSFKHHISEEYKKPEDDLVFNSIRKKIVENVELLSAKELGHFYDWFYNRNFELLTHLKYYDNGKVLHEKMSSYGIDLFFSGGSSFVNIFNNSLGDYEDLMNINMGVNIGYTCDAEQFMAFLDYTACFIAEFRLFINKYYHKQQDDCEDNLKIKKIIEEMNLSSNSSCYKLASSEMEKRKPYDIEEIESLSSWVEFRKTMGNEISYSIPIELKRLQGNESFWLRSIPMLEICSELKKKIGNYKGKITMLHSC